MGDISRYSQYERNTELNNEDILEKCIRRLYSKSSKAQLYEELVNKLVEEIRKGEQSLKTMRDNLSALAGALQQTDLFIKQIEDDGEPMSPEKQQALEMAT